MSEPTQSESVLIKVFVHEPPILGQCPRCSRGAIYAMCPPDPSPEFEQKIKTPRVMCNSGSDPWAERICPDFVFDAAKLGSNAILTNGDRDL